MQFSKFSYKRTPPEYVCSECGAIEIKLWRKSYAPMDGTKLICVICHYNNHRDNEEDGDYLRTLQRDGTHRSCGKTDQFFSWVPAVPTEDGESMWDMWGYTCVPEDGVEWWRNLPNFVGGRY